ncbi:MAG TPA: hypothetical protein VGL04_13190 [Sporichthyaceae bacterium]|jgi:hypothetical protein
MSDPGHSLERRTVLRAALALVGLAAVAPLAGCSGSDAAPPAGSTPEPTPTPVHPSTKGDVYHRGEGDTAHTNPVGTGTPRSRPAR